MMNGFEDFWEVYQADTNKLDEKSLADLHRIKRAVGDVIEKNPVLKKLLVKYKKRLSEPTPGPFKKTFRAIKGTVEIFSVLAWPIILYVILVTYFSIPLLPSFALGIAFTFFLMPISCFHFAQIVMKVLVVGFYVAIEKAIEKVGDKDNAVEGTAKIASGE